MSQFRIVAVSRSDLGRARLAGLEKRKNEVPRLAGVLPLPVRAAWRGGVD